MGWLHSSCLFLGLGCSALCHVLSDPVDSEQSARCQSKVCRRAVVDHTFFFATAEQDELKTLLRNFALFTAANSKAEVPNVELTSLWRNLGQKVSPMRQF